MDKLWRLCRFVGSVATYYISPTPPDFELTHAESFNIDITTKLMAWLVAPDASDQPWPIDKRLLLEYKYKGKGPFLIYFEPGEQFRFPPAVDAVTSLENCLVSVEVSYNDKEDDEPLDITKRAEMLAGPDCRWHGRPFETIDKKLFLFKEEEEGAVITFVFASGNEKQI